MVPCQLKKPFKGLRPRLGTCWKAQDNIFPYEGFFANSQQKKIVSDQTLKPLAAEVASITGNINQGLAKKELFSQPENLMIWNWMSTVPVLPTTPSLL